MVLNGWPCAFTGQPATPSPGTAARLTWMPAPLPRHTAPAMPLAPPPVCAASHSSPAMPSAGAKWQQINHGEEVGQCMM